jgi:hypothetical protein
VLSVGVSLSSVKVSGVAIMRIAVAFTSLGKKSRRLSASRVGVPTHQATPMAGCLTSVDPQGERLTIIVLALDYIGSSPLFGAPLWYVDSEEEHMSLIDTKATVACQPSPARGCSWGMIHRRHFLCVATFLSGVSFLFVPAELALAQQTSGKAVVKISELRPIVKQYVDDLSEEFKKHTGVEFSPEKKSWMVEDTISKMEAQGFYAYIDP